VASAICLPGESGAAREWVRPAIAIAAVQLEIGGDGSSRLGLLSRLRTGVEIAICGDGFDEHTAKLSCHGDFYFVFLQDLEIAQKQ
jgi:hypothetical protein